MVEFKLNEEGYLEDPTKWTPEIAKELIKLDKLEMTDEIMELILKVRKIYEEQGTVPAIRQFSKLVNRDKKELYKLFNQSPMKVLARCSAVPKPSGC